jgi:flagellar basal-body rod protein FlgG
MISGNGIKIMVDAAARQSQRLDAAAHNIANVNTTAFKAEHIYFIEKGIQAGNSSGLVANVDYSQGAIQKTGNVLDMAINGNGFFAVRTKDGVAYARDGRATINEKGELVTFSGNCILGENGKIVISGENIEIGENGTVRVDGSEVERLNIVSFENPSALVKLDEGLYINPDNAAVEEKKGDYQIRSGYLELSNVQALKEMIEMINIQRTFESYQKAIQTMDEQGKASTSRIGKL